MGIPLYAELKEGPKLEVLREALRYFKMKALVKYIENRRYEYASAGNIEAAEIYNSRRIKALGEFYKTDQGAPSVGELGFVLDGIIMRRKICEGLRFVSIPDLIPELRIRKRIMSTSEILECIKETIKRVEENYIGIQQSRFLWLEEKIAALEYAKKNIHICLILNEGVKRLERSSLNPGNISRIQRIIESSKDHVYAEGILGYLRIYLSKLLDYNVRPREISRYYIQELEPPENIISEEEDWDKTNNSEAIVYLKKLIRKMKKR